MGLLTPEERQRIVEETVKDLPRAAVSDLDRLRARAQQAVTRVNRFANDIVAAGGNADQAAFWVTVHKLFRNEMAQFTKEELVFLHSTLLTDIAKGDVG